VPGVLISSYFAFSEFTFRDFEKENIALTEIEFRSLITHGLESLHGQVYVVICHFVSNKFQLF